MEKSLRLVRWIFFLPLGFLASVFIGFLATTITEFIGGASWWVWLVSGAASGGAFIVISFIVAPEKNKFTKWATFSIVVILGILSALGPILVWEEKSRAFAGIAMVIAAFSIIRPFGKSEREITV